MKDLIDLIHNANSIAIVTHTSADGDALGSSFGLAFALMLWIKSICFPGRTCTKMLSFCPASTFISEYRGERYDLCMCLDTSDMKRLENALIFIPVRIKNYNRSSYYKQYAGRRLWIDERASATGEMIYKLVKALNVDITREIAINLYTAIITDTGGFRYSNTTPESHIITADLLSKDIPLQTL